MLEKSAIYLDSNAGAPLQPAVREALLLFLKEETAVISNPSSIHQHGRWAKKAVAESKEKIARSLGFTSSSFDYSQLHFTSSGSEANQTVIRSVLTPSIQLGRRSHWITTQSEHDSNRQMVTWFESQGGEVSYLPLNSEGIPELEHLEGLIRPETTLISVIWVNNETGVITDLSQLIPIAKKFKIPVHVDAAQAWGKLNLQLSALSPDWVTFSGHKIGAIAGCGLVYTSHPKKILSYVLGKQDLGRRGGTENLIGIIAMGAAAGNLDPLTWSARVEPLRNRLESTVFKAIPGVIVNGGGGPRVANTLNLSFENLESEGLVMALDLEGYSVSAGSACSSGVAEPSTVLMAMGRTPAQAKAAIRISLAGEMPWEDLKGFADSLERVVGRFRKLGQSATPNTTLLRSEIGISHDPN